MTNPLTTFVSKDHAGRLWVITVRTHAAWLTVTFCRRRTNGSGVALNRTAAWGADGWDRQSWFPLSPSPVPEAILRPVERHLKELVKQQQAQLQQEVILKAVALQLKELVRQQQAQLQQEMSHG
jgi:hypothetical protein